MDDRAGPDLGVRIIAQGRPEDEKILRARGATWFVSRDKNLSDAVRRFASEGVNGVLDAAALDTPALAAVREGGVFAYWCRERRVIHGGQRGTSVRIERALNATGGQAGALIRPELLRWVWDLNPR
ncbi:hypothetical protein [Streptomyces sp. NPDC059883]|uniref:hypothetical protein n=1 Tax=unclassified Streptomyces TaxID=2593676 RepID=UPI0036658976